MTITIIIIVFRAEEIMSVSKTHDKTEINSSQ